MSDDLTATLERHGITRCGDSACIFGRRGGMMTNGGCRCGQNDPGGSRAPSILAQRLARAFREQHAEIARLTAELAAARAVPADVEALIKEVTDGALEAGSCSALGHTYSLTKDPTWTVPRLKAAIARAISEARAAAPLPKGG